MACPIAWLNEGVGLCVAFEPDSDEGFCLRGLWLAYSWPVHLFAILLLSVSVSRFFELGLHGGVLVGELLYGEVLGVLLGKAQIVLGADEVLLYFGELGDGVVDLLYGFFEFA